jgi:hypothetical protein
MRRIEPVQIRWQFFAAPAWARDQACGCRRFATQHAAGFIALERHRHWPGRLPGSDDRELLIRESFQAAAGQRRPDEMPGFDAANARTQNVVQVGAKLGKRFGQ